MPLLLKNHHFKVEEVEILTNDKRLMQSYYTVNETEVKMNEFHHHYPLLLTPTNAFTAPKITTSLVADKIFRTNEKYSRIKF